MGIDVNFAVQLNRELTEKELSDLSYFSKFVSDYKWELLTADKFLEDDAEILDKGAYFYELESLQRYFSKYYPRGYYPNFYTLIRYLFFKYPEANIYYYGDCDEYCRLAPITLEEAEEHLIDWFKENSNS